MSLTDVDVVERLYEAWNGPDPVEGVIPLLDAGFEWVNPPYAVEHGTRRGHDGWREANRNITSAFESYRHDPGEIREVNGRVVCFTTFVARSRAGGVPYEKRETQVWTLRDGKVLRLEWFHDEDEALRAAGAAGPLGPG